MEGNVELQEQNKSRAVVGFDLPDDVHDSDSIEVLVVPEGSGNAKIGSESPKRTLSRSMRGNLRGLSIHHLRNVQVEELAADIIQDIVGGDDIDAADSSDKSAAHQQFKYLESKSEIRCLTRPMRDKRRIMMLLENYESNQATLKSQSLSLKPKINWHLFWHRAVRTGRRFPVIPWFKSIEGRLGTGGSFFFRFAISVMILDLVVFCLAFIFLSLPQMLCKGGALVVEYPANLSGHRGDPKFTGSEIILGDGSMMDTEMYYGHYADFTGRVCPLAYDVKKAYFLVTCTILLCALIGLSVAFSRAFRHSYHDTRGGGASHVDADLVFSAWDFNTKDERTAALCSDNIFINLEILAAELRRKKQVFGWRDRMRSVLMMVTVEVAIAGLLLTGPVAIYFACLDSGMEDHESLRFKLGIPTLVTALNSLLPKFISGLGRLENWRSSRTFSYLAVIRTSVLHTSNLGVLVYHWFSRVACSTDEVECRPVRCWETFVGTQLYALVVLSFLFDVATAGVHLLRRCLNKLLDSKVRSRFLGLLLLLLRSPEFDVGRTSVDVVYVQCLLWLSVYFSPLLGALVILKLLAAFCLKKLMALLGCYEPVKVWRLGHLETLIRLIHLITFLLCLSAFVYTIVYVTPSEDCGPFKSHRRPYEIFELPSVTDAPAAGDSFGSVVRDVFSSVGFRAFACLVFGILVNYVKVHAHGRHGLAQQLKRQIELESKDRCYYLQTLNLLRTHLRLGRPSEVAEAAKRRRPGINRLVEGTPEHTPKHPDGPGATPLAASPLTPCTGPSYWPPESRHLVTCDVYNVMFPSRVASGSWLDGEPSAGTAAALPPSDAGSLPDEVDRLFDFEDETTNASPDDGDDDGGGDS